MVKVKAYCGFDKQIYDLFREPDECVWEDIVELNDEDWEFGFASIYCPSCNNELNQFMSHFEEIK